MADWIDGVVAEARQRQALIDRVEPLISESLGKLRSIIARDADRLNTELYEGEEIFVVEDSPVPFYDFRVKNIDGNFEAQIRLRSKELTLTCNMSGRNIQLGLLADKWGGISFFQGNQIVSYDEVSRLLFEPEIRSEFQL